VAIVWRKEMSIDQGLIDDDHKWLISLVNAVDDVKTGATMQDDLSVILSRLGAYARLHFQREERLQVSVRFIYAKAHGLNHTVLLRDLDGIRAECEAQMDPVPLLAFRARVSDFLYHWLVDHIIKTDVLMKPFVAQMRSATAGVVSLAKTLQASEIEVKQNNNAMGAFGWRP
jgi:hemerythrin